MSNLGKYLIATGSVKPDPRAKLRFIDKLILFIKKHIRRNNYKYK